MAEYLYKYENFIKRKKNSIACIAIGKKFLIIGKKIYFLLESLLQKYNLGLIVFTEDLIDINNPNWKKPTWQRLLVGQKLKKNFLMLKTYVF